MQNWKKIILLIVVLLPSVFFLSKAFNNNSIKIQDEKLVVTGAGGLELALDDIERIEVIKDLPELNGTGGFSLGLIKKGKFIRASDQKKVHVLKNGDGYYLHIITKDQEIYLNTESELGTEGLLSQLPQ